MSNTVGGTNNQSSTVEVSSTATPPRQNDSDPPNLKTLPCGKNPTHGLFVPTQKLTSAHFPEGFRSPVLVDAIRHKSADTVRLRVYFTSSTRPSALGHSSLRGKNSVRGGSGTAFIMDMARTQQCPIESCTHGPRPHEVSGVFKVVTVSHVIFDDSEASSTLIDFFVDDERNPGSIIQAQGVRVSSRDLKNNNSVIECITHDLGLCQKLQRSREQKDRLFSELTTTRSASLGATSSTASNTYLAVVISHPHGAVKHVTFGRVTKVTRSDPAVLNVMDTPLVLCRFNHTAATCVGSGGGSVTVYSSKGCCVGFAPHSGVSEDGTHISGLGWMTESDYNVFATASQR